MEPWDVSHSQFVILAILLWAEGHQLETTQIFIVQLSKLDKMTVSQSLKKMAAKDGGRRWILRQEHASDTRAKQVSLTESSRALVRQLVPLVEGVDGTFFGKLSLEDQQSLLQILGQLAG